MIKQKDEHTSKKNDQKFGGLVDLLQAYDKLEELTAKLMELNIRQLDGRIAKEDANDDLYLLADVYCDLSEEIMNCKEAMLGEAKTAYIAKQKSEE